MAQPYHRGSHHNNNNNNMTRNTTGSGHNSWGTRAEEANLTLLEMENNQRWNELSDQVSTLKALSLDINSEVKSQNKLLDNMGKSFGSTTEMFRSTIGKLGVMLSGGGGSKHMYYLVGFVVVVFIVLYFYLRQK